jgi:hypothetical protein
MLIVIHKCQISKCKFATALLFYIKNEIVVLSN